MGRSAYERRPAARPPGREVVVEVGSVALSGLLAEPHDGATPRALVVAIPGSGMHAGYFDAAADPSLSLLVLGATLGFTVLALDRPGMYASADLDDEQVRLFPQSRLLSEAIARFRTTHEVGAGVFVVAHSYGVKTALVMASEASDGTYLGIDAAGCGLHFAVDWRREGRPDPDAPPGDRGDPWGHESLYPAGTFDRERMPLHRIPDVQAGERVRWPDDLRSIAGGVTAPIRITFGEHDRLWPLDPASLEELRSLFDGTRRCSIELLPGAAHNISLGWAARSYHLRALAFAEECMLAAGG